MRDQVDMTTKSSMKKTWWRFEIAFFVTNRKMKYQVGYTIKTKAGRLIHQFYLDWISTKLSEENLCTFSGRTKIKRRSFDIKIVSYFSIDFSFIQYRLNVHHLVVVVDPYQHHRFETIRMIILLLLDLMKNFLNHIFIV